MNYNRQSEKNNNNETNSENSSSVRKREVSVNKKNQTIINNNNRRNYYLLLAGKEKSIDKITNMSSNDSNEFKNIIDNGYKSGGGKHITHEVSQQNANSDQIDENCFINSSSSIPINIFSNYISNCNFQLNPNTSLMQQGPLSLGYNYTSNYINPLLYFSHVPYANCPFQMSNDNLLNCLTLMTNTNDNSINGVNNNTNQNTNFLLQQNLYQNYASFPYCDFMINNKK